MKKKILICILSILLLLIAPLLVCASEGDGFEAVSTADTEAPIITLLGSSDDITIEVYSDFNDPGAEVKDNIDGSWNIKGSGTVDTASLGNYTLTYTATDNAGNVAQSIKRTVNVVDTTPPVITLKGESTIRIFVGDTFDDPGVSVTDNYDHSVDISVSGNEHIDLDNKGEYDIKYIATDDSGNTSSVQRHVSIMYEGSDNSTDDDTQPVFKIEQPISKQIEYGTAYSKSDSGRNFLFILNGRFYIDNLNSESEILVFFNGSKREDRNGVFITKEDTYGSVHFYLLVKEEKITDIYKNYTVPNSTVRIDLKHNGETRTLLNKTIKGGTYPSANVMVTNPHKYPDYGYEIGLVGYINSLKQKETNEQVDKNTDAIEENKENIENNQQNVQDLKIKFASLDARVSEIESDIENIMKFIVSFEEFFTNDRNIEMLRIWYREKTEDSIANIFSKKVYASKVSDGWKYIKLDSQNTNVEFDLDISKEYYMYTEIEYLDGESKIQSYEMSNGEEGLNTYEVSSIPDNPPKAIQTQVAVINENSNLRDNNLFTILLVLLGVIIGISMTFGAYYLGAKRKSTK